MLLGDREEALHKFESALALRQRMRLFDNYTAQLLSLLPRAFLRSDALSPERRTTLKRVHAQALRQTSRRRRNWRPPTLVNEAIIQERRGDPHQADERFAEAVAIAREQEAGFFVSDALYEWGCVLRQRGERERATASLREAREIAERGGNRWLERQCNAELAGLIETR